MPSQVPIEATTDPEQMPAPADVARLYADAAASAAMRADPSAARAFATLYAWARALPGAAAVSAHDGSGLIGFGYGYSWNWAAMTDAWSLDLREHLGPLAGQLDPSFSLVLLTVAPHARGAGLGRRLLDALVALVDEPVAWVVTTAADSPAHRLYEGAGWVRLGAGPAAADGAPGLVLMSRLR